MPVELFHQVFPQNLWPIPFARKHSPFAWFQTTLYRKILFELGAALVNNPLHALSCTALYFTRLFDDPVTPVPAPRSLDISSPFVRLPYDKLRSTVLLLEASNSIPPPSPPILVSMFRSDVFAMTCEFRVQRK